ncbi:MAG: AMP-binding protein [Promethearchaeota archaeon]
MKRAKGTIVSRKSGGGGYQSLWIYIPSKLAKDSSFPFSVKEEVTIEIRNDSLIITKRDELLDIIDNYGIENATLPKLIQTKAEENDDKIFLYFKDDKYSYLDLHLISNRIGNGILKIIKNLKLRKRPRIAVLLPNCPEFIFCWFGIVKAGCIFVPINYELEQESLINSLSTSDSEILILDYQFWEKFKEIQEKLIEIKKIILINAPKDFRYDENVVAFSEILSNNNKIPKVNVKDWQIMEILFTAGTTGEPKAVIIRNFLVLTGINVGKELKDLGLDENSIIYCPLPLFHGAAQLLNILPAMFYNASVVITEKFEPSSFWSDVKKYNATCFSYFGEYLNKLVNLEPTKYDRKNTIKFAFGFGVSKEIWKAFENRFGIPLIEMWTLTEAVGITINKIGSKGGKIGSVGKAVSGYEIKIVNQNGQELPPGPDNIGEILTRYKVLPLLVEYYKNPTENITREGLDRWVYTGDFGYIDNDGFLYFIGKKTDIIQRKGKIIFASDIEGIVNAHPDIIECAAVGIPNSKNNEEEIRLCVIIRKGSNLTSEDIYRYLIQNLEFSIVPRYIEIRKKLPKSATKMIRKYILREEPLDPGITWDTKIKNFISKKIKPKGVKV